MPFVKLDCGILNSTLWFDHDAREVFLTALLMASPVEFVDTQPQIAIRSLDLTGWVVPPGWYGITEAASVGIIRRAGLEEERGLDALERLGGPDLSSRSKAFDGRRLIRVDGGFCVLNYFAYRDRDYTSAERSRRYRERRKQHAVSPQRHTVASRDITQAEAEGEGEVGRDLGSGSPVRVGKTRVRQREKRRAQGARDDLRQNAKQLQVLAPEVMVSGNGEATVSGKQTWLTPHADAWEAAYGGKPPFGVLAKQLAPLEKAHGADLVLERWRYYLAQTEAEYASPARFAATFGRWCREAEKPASIQTFDDDDFDNGRP